MLQYPRPRKPDDFEDAVREAKWKIEVIIARSEDPRSTDFDDVWRSYKDVFAKAQHGKCGFCDTNVLRNGDGTLDHLHPKTELQDLPHDPATWGKEKSYSASLTGRDARLLCKRAYYWLAYEWDNYLFSCGVCNSKFKRCLFPVASVQRSIPPSPQVHEPLLLLSCYGSLRPGDHLLFNKDGSVERYDGSEHGYETIRTCGLDRGPLRRERGPIALRAYTNIDRLNRALIGDERYNEALCDLRAAGEEWMDFAGAVRAIAERELELTWDEILLL